MATDGVSGHHVTPPGDWLDTALHQAASILPDQGPIGVFIHHNTLHAFQHLPFHEGVQAGAKHLGARPYPELETFRAWLAEGRIDARDLDAALDDRLGDAGAGRLAFGLTRRALWSTLLTDTLDDADEAGLVYRRTNGVATGLAPALRWLADPHDARQRLVQAALRVAPRPPLALEPPLRPREALLRLGGEDVDAVVHRELIPLCASFLDQGQATHPMPHREGGFLAAVARLLGSGFSEARGCPGVNADLRRVLDQQIEPRAVVEASLAALGVPQDLAPDLIVAECLALPGWAGMFARLERHPAERLHGPPTSLIDYLAVRLLFVRRAVERVAQALGVGSAWSSLRARPAVAPPRPTVDAVLVAQLAAAAGLSAVDLEAVAPEAWQQLWAEVEAASPIERRRVWLEAYEAHYRRAVLSGIAARRALPVARPVDRPLGQLIFCIDEREESIRRAVEEQGPGWETFGAAGFFGLAIDYQGIDDHRPGAYCPVVVQPTHEVREGVADHDHERHASRSAFRGALNRIERRLGQLSRTLPGGAGMALAVGPVAGAVAALRVFAPRTTLDLKARVDEAFAPHPTTRVSAWRAEDDEARTRPLGFSTEEAADRVVALLRNIGLVTRFAPIVVVLGHGSTSLNNPHESAHDCGACGGRRGGPNARAFADIANRPDVRAAVARRGLTIPDDTWFVGALHDTSDDRITCFELDMLPAALVPAFEVVQAMMARAAQGSAQERCRRFHNVPLGVSPAEALGHVQARASHLAQPRPEYGHCTNAAAVVGRRTLTRGLHLDRRAFLVSYDPSIDPDNTLLERILAAVGPVGAGISLEYYFSSVDPERFGCGTKLPHNVTGLIGVMNGHMGDLRTGLPVQMTELHEPMRLLLIVEATPEALLGVAARQAEVRELVVNRWVQLVSVHPESGEMVVFTDHGFQPYEPSGAALPTVARSVDWHGASRDHLGPAFVTAGLVP